LQDRPAWQTWAWKPFCYLRAGEIAWYFLEFPLLQETLLWKLTVKVGTFSGSFALQWLLSSSLI
jgi:lipid-A-disaccharide synthase-like uncharacterized protein